MGGKSYCKAESPAQSSPTPAAAVNQEDFLAAVQTTAPGAWWGKSGSSRYSFAISVAAIRNPDSFTEVVALILLGKSSLGRRL